MCVLGISKLITIIDTQRHTTEKIGEDESYSASPSVPCHAIIVASLGEYVMV